MFRGLFARSAAVLMVAALAAACGSSSSPAAPSAPPGSTGGGTPAPAPGATNGTFSATIAGAPWTATTISVTYNNGSLSMAGGDGRQTFALSVNVNRGPGTYQAGVVDPQNIVVATLSAAGSPSQWIVGPTFGSGSVTLTSLTATSASGTFALTMAASAGTGATGARAVTNGVFNVTFTGSGTLPPGSTNVNGTLTALVDGAAWKGAVTARAATAGGLLSVSGQDTDTRFLTFVVPASAGTYSLALANPNGALANMILGAQQWTTSASGGAGTVTVTTITSTRVTGTFTMTLQPSLANSAPRPVQVTNGVFDLTF